SSEIIFNGTAQTTNFVSATQLTTTISSTDIGTAGTKTVTVATPAPGGGTSNSLNFTVTAPASPTISTSGSLTAFSTTVGTPSTPQSYEVSGAGLTNNIIINAP